MGKAPKIIFRDMTMDDVGDVYNIEKESFKLPWSIAGFSYEIYRDDSISLVGEFDEEIIAYACVWISFEEADLANIAVAEKFRGQGVGRKLLAEIIRRAKLRGVTALTLEVRVSNVAAIKLYESFGLRSVGVRKGYYEDGEDALIMWNTKI